MTEQTESDRRLAEMQGGWQIRERPFTSRAPLVGPLLARFREAWNNIATRWYVQPMIQQQSEFNLAVLRTVQALARRVEAQEIGAATTRSMLGQRLADVEERISRVEQNNPRT